MILKGSQRGNAAELARHLMNAQDNEHVELHDIRGFASERLNDAMAETQAISAEEAQASYQRMLAWSRSDRPSNGGSLGEWVFSRDRRHAQATQPQETRPTGCDLFRACDGHRLQRKLVLLSPSSQQVASLSSSMSARAIAGCPDFTRKIAIILAFGCLLRGRGKTA